MLYHSYTKVVYIEKLEYTRKLPKNEQMVRMNQIVIDGWLILLTRADAGERELQVITKGSLGFEIKQP